MPNLKTYDLFISHAWKYNDEYYKLEEFLNGASNFYYRNYSVPKHDPFDSDENLKEALKRQIRPVNCVLILAGMYANHSKWIKFEIDYALQIGKPIIVVKPWGQERVPVYLQENANEIVGWNTSTIVSAIRKHSL